MDTATIAPAWTSERTTTRRLRSHTVPMSSLTSADRHRMWTLFERYYADVRRDQFEADLDAKDAVILLKDRDEGLIQGFSTVQLYEGTQDGQRFAVLFSGDTIIEPRYWGQNALHLAFIRLALREKLKRPGTPLYWFLISKGYKTYLLLARNVPSHWPRHDQPTPEPVTRLMDRLAREKFGEAWKPELGVLQFPQCAGRLKRGVAPVEDRLLDDPQIRFFVRRNPGHVNGDELVCLGRLDLRLLRAAVRKLWKSR